mmetsp:Transcript_13995/g.48145  ORF Transcript_13995/g.48145 Transcript_13995/m.48145 type:complete len:217 (-) Transcript_13995:430-1080(-)
MGVRADGFLASLAARAATMAPRFAAVSAAAASSSSSSASSGTSSTLRGRDSQAPWGAYAVGSRKFAGSCAPSAPMPWTRWLRRGGSLGAFFARFRDTPRWLAALRLPSSTAARPPPRPRDAMNASLRSMRALRSSSYSLRPSGLAIGVIAAMGTAAADSATAASGFAAAASVSSAASALARFLAAFMLFLTGAALGAFASFGASLGALGALADVSA